MQELIKALIKAQPGFKEIKKDTQAYNYKYAPLDVVKEATLPSLLANGLTIMQFPVSQVVSGSQVIGVKTVLAHESGETIEEVFSIATTQNDPQKLGSLITYFRRYSWLAVLGVVPEDEDDDAFIASDSAQEKVAQANIPMGSPEYRMKGGFKEIKGKMLSEIPEKDLMKRYNWCKDEIKKKGEKAAQVWKDDANNIHKFLGLKNV